MGKQNGSCWWCVKAVKWIPVIFILTIVVWSYYAYVVQLCFYTVNNNIQKAFYLFFYHILFFLYLWSYWQTVFTDLIPVPDKFKIPDVEMEKLQQAENEEVQRQILERFSQDLPITNRTIKGDIRICEKCQLIKPDRAHHCSVCGTCVLKMDHHCPWVNNCVGFHNYKFFMLFLAYALLYCTFITATSLQYFIRFWKGELDGMGRFHLLFLFFVALMFAVSLNSLFFYHCYLVLHNRSTLEAFRPPMFRTGKDKDGFSLGKYNNFQEVFGDNARLWFLPVSTSLGNGVTYPVRSQHQGTPNTYDSMGSTRNRRVNKEERNRSLIRSSDNRPVPGIGRGGLGRFGGDSSQNHPKPARTHRGVQISPPCKSIRLRIDELIQHPVEYTTSPIEQMTLVEEATILALGAGTAVIGPTVDASQPLVDGSETV